MDHQTHLGHVIVTGGASGLGAAVAHGVVQHGGVPHVLDRDLPAAGVAGTTVDLADTRAAEQAVREFVESTGQLSAVVTCAGTDTPGPLDAVDGATWDRIVAVNLLGTAAVIRAALPALRASHGRIVTIGSTLGLRACGDATAYCASKFGVVGFTRALAAELAGEVGVSLVTPGGMATNFFAGRDAQYQPAADQPMNDPGRVADAVLFALCQPPGTEIRELVVTPAVEPSWP